MNATGRSEDLGDEEGTACHQWQDHTRGRQDAGLSVAQAFAQLGTRIRELDVEKGVPKEKIAAGVPSKSRFDETLRTSLEFLGTLGIYGLLEHLRPAS